MKKYLVYLLKHAPFLMKSLNLLVGNGFWLVSQFVKTDPKLIIFSSFTGKKFNDSPKILFDRLRFDPDFADCKFVWAFEEPKKFEDQDLQTVKIDSLKYFYLSFKARVWITNVNIERGLKYKKKNQIYMNTWHCVPLKKMGNSVRGRNDYDFSYVDYLVYSGEYEMEIFKRDFNARTKSLVKSLMPRNDALLQKHLANGPIREKLNISEDQKVILYAPTWRESLDYGRTYNFDIGIDSEKWLDQLPSNYVVLFRAHHFTGDYSNITFCDRFIDVSHFSEVTDLMLESDALISDYSSVIFDFALMGKPIFCYASDFEEYSKDRGFYFDLNAEVPNGIITEENKLLELLKNINFERQEMLSNNFRKKFISADKPGTDLCVRYLKKNMSV